MYKKTVTNQIAKKRYSFKKGFLQVSLADKEALKVELRNALGNPSRSYFSTKLNKGIVEISMTLFTVMGDIFQKYGITDVWDITEE